MPLLLSFRFLTLLDFMHYRTGTTTILTSYISLHVTIKRLRTAFRSITPWTSRNFMSIGCHQKKFTYTGKTPLRNSTEESAPRWAFENQWVSCPLTSTTTTKNKNFFHFNLGLQCFTRFRDLAFSISSLHEEERSFKFSKLWLLFSSCGLTSVKGEKGGDDVFDTRYFKVVLTSCVHFEQRLKNVGKCLVWAWSVQKLFWTIFPRYILCMTLFWQEGKETL